MASLQKHLRADFSQERDTSNYKARYQFLKDKLKFLLYENECFQEALRSTQRQLLKANRDKSFLLDRLLYYERVDASLSDSDEETDSSGDDVAKVNNVNSVKMEDSVINQQSHVYSSSTINSEIPAKKKKPNVKPVKSVDYQTDSSSISVVDKREQVPEHMYNLTDSEDESIQYYVNDIMNCPQITDGHMTPEEVERHLESRQNYLELVPEKAPPTVPTEMFSNDTSLDKLE